MYEMMNEKLLLSLANAGCLNSYRTENIGLVSGTLGVSLFLYHFKHHKGEGQNDGYGDFADGLIESFWERLYKDTLLCFDAGLSGLVFGISHLIDEGFLDGDSDELFSEIDDLFSTPLSLADLESDFESAVPFFSKGLYTIVKHDEVSANRLFEEYCRYAPEISMQPSLNYTNSLLLFLNKLSYGNREMDSPKLSRLFDIVNGWLARFVDDRLYAHSDLIVFRCLLEECSPQIVHLMAKERIDTLNAILLDDYEDICYNLGWKSMVFGQSHRLKDYVPKDFRIEGLLDLSPTAKIVVGLKDGMSGLGLTLIINA
jgi:hypothetical protein